MPDKISAARVSQSDTGARVRVSVPAGTRLEDLFVDPNLINVIRGFGGRPGGCETCLSGSDIYMAQFEEVILVEFEE